jgi:hypothetical protein
VLEHAYASNYGRKGGRNLCYKPSQQNQVHEQQCKEMEKKIVKTDGASGSSMKLLLLLKVGNELYGKTAL